MKKQLSFFLAGLVISLFLLAACNKDDNTPPAKTKTELISTGTWKFSVATANGVDISNQNPPFEPCKKDNIVSFSASGAGVVNEGSTKCNAADPDDIPFTWSFMNSETTLHISTALFSTGNTDFTLESVSETQLVVSQGYTPVAGPTYLIRITFIH